MNKMFAIKLLVVFALFCPAVMGLREISYHEFVKELNEERWSFAFMFKIPNMHQVTWDDNLAKKVTEAETNTSLQRDLVNVIDIGSYVNLWFFRTMDVKTRDDIPNWFNSRHYADSFLEYFYPLQTTIGCARFRLPEDPTKSAGRCIMAPIRTSPREIFRLRGEPGTQCPPGSVVTEIKDDLKMCALIPPTTTTTPKREIHFEVTETSVTSSAAGFFVMSGMLISALFFFFFGY